MPAPSSGGGQSRASGSETVRVNSRKPPETRPSTPSTRARREEGRLWPKAATVAPQSESMKHHSTIEPSWFPQVPVIRYSRGTALEEKFATFSTVKSETMPA